MMLFAKELQQQLQKAWNKEVLERLSVAVVEGQVAQPQGTITSWLKENQAHIVYSSATPHEDQKAVTHYRVLKNTARFSLLKIRLETGRKNQIRVPMRDRGTRGRRQGIQYHCERHAAFRAARQDAGLQASGNRAECTL